MTTMTAVWTIPCFLSGGAAFFLAALIIFRRKTGRVFLALVIVNWKAVLAWLDRYPFLRAILRSDPPTAIGTRFEVN